VTITKEVATRNPPVVSIKDDIAKAGELLPTIVAKKITRRLGRRKQHQHRFRQQRLPLKTSSSYPVTFQDLMIDLID